jgi:hypothetical protein
LEVAVNRLVSREGREEGEVREGAPELCCLRCLRANSGESDDRFVEGEGAAPGL